MSKRTIKKLHGHIWTELPITDEVIEQVEQLREQVGWPLMMHGPYFEWKPAQLLMEEREEWDAEVAEEIVYDDENTETVSDQETWSAEEFIEDEMAYPDDQGIIVTEEDDATSSDYD